jgi:thiol:disulfide interchange protein DsbD
VRFFTNDGWINSDEPQKVRIGDDGAVILTLRRAEVFLGKERPARLYGVVKREGGWTTGEPLEAMIVSPALIP